MSEFYIFASEKLIAWFRLLLATSRVWNGAMQIIREAKERQMLYRLVDDLDHMLGRAVTSETEEEVRLHEIFVEREYRGRGYGDALMEAVLGGCASKQITLCTGLGNIPFFERHDFEVTGNTDSLVFMCRKPPVF